MPTPNEKCLRLMAAVASDNLNTTDDDVPAVGMLLARLETLRAQQGCEGISKVRLLPPSKYAYMLPLHGNTQIRTDGVIAAA
jgi:hypothetical protein